MLLKNVIERLICCSVFLYENLKTTPSNHNHIQETNPLLTEA